MWGGGELARRKARSSSSILGWLLDNYLGCVLHRASRLQKTSEDLRTTLMVLLQDFSITGLEISGHSPLTVKRVHQVGKRSWKKSFVFSNVHNPGPRLSWVVNSRSKKLGYLSQPGWALAQSQLVSSVYSSSPPWGEKLLIPFSLAFLWWYFLLSKMGR